MEYELTDRYKALGIPYPDPETVCEGQCEGIGVYPHHSVYQYMFIDAPTELEATEQLRWDDAHKKSWFKFPFLHFFTCDGWHFIKCPDCGGTGKKSAHTSH